MNTTITRKIATATIAAAAVLGIAATTAVPANAATTAKVVTVTKAQFTMQAVAGNPADTSGNTAFTFKGKAGLAYPVKVTIQRVSATEDADGFLISRTPIDTVKGVRNGDVIVVPTGVERVECFGWRNGGVTYQAIVTDANGKQSVQSIGTAYRVADATALNDRVIVQK